MTSARAAATGLTAFDVSTCSRHGLAVFDVSTCSRRLVSSAAYTPSLIAVVGGRGAAAGGDGGAQDGPQDAADDAHHDATDAELPGER